MSFELVTEPIDHWPDPDTRGRAASNFTATYDQTIDLLRTELTHLGATGAAVIQVVTQRGAADLRRDGLLRARAVIDHPGVRLSITTRKHGPLTYATDAFEQRYYNDPPAWQSNLRAIALGLQDLRRLDRYGITKRGEQYRGFRAIEAGPGRPGETPAMTQLQAAEVIERLTIGDHGTSRQIALDSILRGGPGMPRLVRLARIAAHPDRHAGDHTLSNQLLEALRVLGYDKD